MSKRYTRDFYLAFGFALLAALLHTYALTTELTIDVEFRTSTSHTIPWILLVIELGLLSNAAGLWSGTVKGMRVSIIALIGVGLGYLVWYVYSRQILKLLLSKPFYSLHPEAVPPHLFGLIDATWLNLVVAVMSFILLIWEIKTLRGTSCQGIAIP